MAANGLQMANSMVPAGGAGPPGGSISLALLIDFIIQRTYHELTVLAELLPRKTDMERKIEIYQFASRTRQLFVRLLALVKWAASVSKVDKSSSIMAFLDKQSMIFIETADALSRMARETLVHARLPNFHLPAAVEVLTLGTYSRMPLCIRDKIIPPDPITAVEKKQTLARLSQVIEYRLATTSLPPQIRKNKIENGRVKFTVEHEFEATLTLMGDGPNVPWSLLDINILVEDKETGDGKSLVHPFQVKYIHELLQSRLRDCDNPLLELYTVLHTFSQSLQLEVLHSQTKRLCQDRLGDLIRVEEYVTGRSLTISYWKELAVRELKTDLGYRVTAQVSTTLSPGLDHVSGKPLQIIHHPPLSNKDSEVAEQSIRSDQLSLEKLLIHTIYMRTRSRLLELKQELLPKLGQQQSDCVIQGSPAVLHLPILSPCLRSEQLLITVDTRTGNFQAHIPQDDPPAGLMSELQQTLNGDKSRVETVVGELRFWITQRRCQKTLQHLPVSVYDKLPLLYPSDSPMSRLGKHKFFLRLHKHPNTWIVVVFKEKARDIEFVCHLAIVKPVSIDETTPNDDPSGEWPKMYYKVLEVNELDMFLLTHGPSTAIETQEVAGTKRKSSSPQRSEVARDLTPGPGKRTKHPAYLLPDLSHVVALCDERIPFASLATQLTRREILHQGLTVEALGAGLALKLIRLPPVEGVSKEAMNELNHRLLAATLRMQVKGSRAWMLEFLFHASPLISTSPWEQGPRFPVYLSYDVTTADEAGRTVEAILQDWAHIAHLYSSIQGLATLLHQKEERQHFTVKSYNFKKLVLAYGPARSATAAVTWKAQERRFHLGLGCSGQLGSNPHSALREQLEFFLNRERNCGYLARVLHETYEPLASLAKLPSTLQLGVMSTKPPIPVQSFTVIAHSPTHLRLAYCNLYCLDIRLQTAGQVSIRDGAFSVFDKSKVIEEFCPTQGLKAFLSKYVDERAVTRRRSQSEDDHPPSPVTMEHSSESSPSHFLGQHSRTSVGAVTTGASPAGQQRNDLAGLRFHAPLTPSGTSNPHTPASPHINQQQAQQQPTHGFGSSPATSSFSLASPPSLPPSGGVNPSPSMLPHPSPAAPGSAFGVANSPLANPLHAPSPAGMLPTPSPNPAGMNSGSAHNIESSPFPPQSLASPAPNTWPGSPGMPRPSPARPGGPPSSASHHSPHGGAPSSTPFPGSFVSRVLPQRSWAGAIPTILTHEAFDMLCTPVTLPGELDETFSAGGMMAPLERFLGCIYMRRILQRVIQESDCLTSLPITEPGVIPFRCDSLQGRVTVHPVHMQSLQLKLSPSAPEYRDQWALEELQVLERFFEVRVMAIPFKPVAVHAFGRLLNAPFRILRDLVQLMKLELMPGTFSQHFKWSVQFCLTVPPSAPSIVPIGASSVLTARNKILFFLYIRRLGMLPEVDGASVVLPLVYDFTNNITQLAERRETATGNMGGLGPLAHTASMMLKRFAECSHMMGLQPGECSIYPAIRDLLSNLTLPNEPPAMAVGVNAPVNTMVPMGLGSGPGMAGGMVAGPGTPMNAMQSPMQMQGGPMGMQGPAQQGQVSMPIQVSPYGQGNANPMTPVMSMGPGVMNMGQPNMGQQGPGNMQMQ